MFKSLKQLFSHINQQAKDPVIGLDLAMAVLLYEVAAADNRIDEREELAMQTLLADSFKLDKENAKLLMNQAKEHQHNAVSLQQFTHILRDSLDRPLRINFIHTLWQVANSDDDIDVNEAHIVRKINDLLHLNHSDFIKAKINVIES